ncbi:MAG: ABC transporter permease [Acidobacteriaceae bacterium]
MFERKRSAEDFAAEVEAHLKLEAEELKREGRSEEQAHTEARRAFGNVTAARERFYLKGRWLWMDRLGRDLRFALRGLRHSPGFALTVILTLALGVGANTAVFSVMNAVLLRSLPVTDPQSVVYLRTSDAPQRTGTINTHETFSYPVYDALRRQRGALSDVMAVGALSTDKVNVRVGAQPELAEADMVSGNFFRGLGVKMARGRGFLEEEEGGHATVAVLSYNYWTRRFARDPNILGKTLFVKGVPFSIVGITAEGFEGTEAGQSTDFWIPLQNRAEFNVLGNPPAQGKLYQQDPTWWCLVLIGRLAPGVSREQAASQLQNVFQAAAYVGLGSPMKGEKLPVLSLIEAKNFPGYGDLYGKPLHMLMAMVALVLLIALTNVVMLLMARNASRQREFSLRLALGAGRGELLRQLLTESLLLVTAGGILAWIFAEIATRLLGTWAQIEASLAPDTTVLLFTLGVLLFAAVLFGLAPLRVALAGGAELALKGSAATSGKDAGRTRTGRLIVALQMALCMVLLVGGGLLLRTLENLKNIPLGMDTDGLLVFGLNPQGLYGEKELVSFYQELQRRLRVLPGVESTAVMLSRLGSGWSNNDNAEVDGKAPNVSKGTSDLMRNNDIGPDFFHTLGVPVVLGREFTDADNSTSQHVAVVNELFAQRFLPGQNPLGHQVNGMTIIGVVKNHKYRSMDEEPIPMAWWDYAQAPAEGAMNVEMRVRGDALAILPEVRKVVAQLDPDVPLIKPISQREQFESTISRQLMFARLAEGFALLALVLVATGLYGTLAYRVNRRTAEIGVRMALGARRKQVVWMVLEESLLLTAAGVLAGIPLAMLVGRALTSSLYGVKPWDGVSYGAAALGLAWVALLASTIPAARAASVDPTRALRRE